LRRPPRGGVDRNHALALRFLWAETSPPARGRGSKPAQCFQSPFCGSVAPRAGAWIETDTGLLRCAGAGVAPRAGAWIETGSSDQFASPSGRRPPRGGVDRNRSCHPRLTLACVAPRAGAWIETTLITSLSAPVNVAPRAGAWIETAERYGFAVANNVAPRAGAWIETLWPDHEYSILGCRPPRGGVDRNLKAHCVQVLTSRRPPRGGRGSKPSYSCNLTGGCVSALARGRASKRVAVPRCARPERRLPRGGVDRNLLHRAA